MPEVCLCQDADWARFEAIANYLNDRRNAVFTAQADGLDQRYWDLVLEGMPLTLHLEHYLGIFLFSADVNAASLLQTLSDELRAAGLADPVKQVG